MQIKLKAKYITFNKIRNKICQDYIKTHHIHNTAAVSYLEVHTCKVETIQISKPIQIRKMEHLNIISLRHIHPKLVLKILISNNMANRQIRWITQVRIHNLLWKDKQLVRKEETVICIMIDLRKIPEAFQILWAQVHTWFSSSNSRLSNKICSMELHRPNACRVTGLHNQAPIQPINTEPFSHHLLPMVTVPWVVKLQHLNKEDKVTLANLSNRLGRIPWRIIMMQVHILSNHNKKHQGKVCNSQDKKSRFRDPIFRVKGRKKGCLMISWEYVGHSMLTWLIRIWPKLMREP